MRTVENASSGPRTGVPWRTRTWFLAIAAGVLAFLVRAVGLKRSNDLFIDELTYARFADQLAHGHFPNEAGAPFFLHPPGSFVLNGLVVKVFGLSGSAMDLVYDLRWVSAALGAVLVALSFLLVRHLLGLRLASLAAVLLTVDPFVLRMDSRVMIETPATVLLIAGWLVLLHGTADRPDQGWWRREVVSGLLLGMALLTKDVTFVPGIVTVVLAVLWRRTVSLRTAARVVAAAAVPYLTYLTVIFYNGLLPQWWHVKSSGLLRMAGIEQTTGFNAVSSVSLTERLVDEFSRFGTSYVLLLACVPAGVMAACSRRAGRRFVGIGSVCTGLLGIYAVAGGAAEEQFGYYVLITSVLALCVAVGELVKRRPPLLRPAIAITTVFVAATALLGVSGRFVIDDGFVQTRSWMTANLPSSASVGVTGVTGEFAFPKYDVSPSIASLERNQDNYVLTSSAPLRQGYGYADPKLLDWLGRHAKPVFDTYGPTNGHTIVWQLNRRAVKNAVEAGTTIPPVSRGLR